MIWWSKREALIFAPRKTEKAAVVLREKGSNQEKKKHSLQESTDTGYGERLLPKKTGIFFWLVIESLLHLHSQTKKHTSKAHGKFLRNSLRCSTGKGLREVRFIRFAHSPEGEESSLKVWEATETWFSKISQVREIEERLKDRVSIR